MTQEAGQSDAVIADYVRSGWHVIDPRQRRPDIDFVPDFLLRKGEDFLVIEVKQQGTNPPETASRRSVAEMRRIVERQPNWHFAVKLQASPFAAAPGELAVNDVQDRLRIAGTLLMGGHADEAILIAWTAIETSLRRLVSESVGASTDQDLPVLIRNAYEAEMMSDSELRRIEHARSLKSRIVHGFKASASSDDATRILDLAAVLSERADTLAATVRAELSL